MQWQIVFGCNSLKNAMKILISIIRYRKSRTLLESLHCLRVTNKRIKGALFKSAQHGILSIVLLICWNVFVYNFVLNVWLYNKCTTITISYQLQVHVPVYYTEHQKKHHFFRVTFTEIHCIKMIHIWSQIR